MKEALAIFGHSHAAALSEAAVDLDRVIVHREKTRKRDGTDFETFKNLAQGRTIALATGGSQYAEVGLLKSDRIPYRQLVEFFRHAIRTTELRYQFDLKNSGAYHLLAPPPKRDNDQLKAYLDQRHKRNDWVIADPEYRLTTWEAYREAMRWGSAKNGVTLIEPNADVLDEKGYLRPEYASEDTVHANAAYARKQIIRVLALLDSKGEAR